MHLEIDFNYGVALDDAISRYSALKDGSTTLESYDYLGLGTVVTTLHGVAEPTIRDTLGLPAQVKIAATIPVGWPAAKFGPVNRKPVADFVHRNRW